MGGVKDAVFGKSSQGKVDYYSPYSKDQKNLLKSLLEILSGQLGKGVDPYPGELVPGASDIQSQVFGKASDVLGGIGSQDYGQNTRDVIQRILSGSPSMTATTPGAVGTERNEYGQPYDAGSDMEYWTKAFLDPAMQTWNDRVAPQVREKFIAQNIASSSGANNALSRSAGDMMTNLTGQLASIMQGNKQAADTRSFTGEESFLNRLFSGGQSEADRQMQAQNLNATLGENVQNRMMSVPSFESGLKATEDPTAQLLNMLGIGTEQRNILGQQNTADYTNWMQSQAYSNPWLKLLGLTGGTPQQLPGGSVAGSQQSGLFQDIVAPVVGGTLAGGWNPMQMFSGFFSPGANPLIDATATGNLGANSWFGTGGR